MYINETAPYLIQIPKQKKPTPPGAGVEKFGERSYLEIHLHCHN